MIEINRHELLKLRRKLEKYVDTIGGQWYGAGIDHTTGEVDFRFDLDGRTYSIHIKELTN